MVEIFVVAWVVFWFYVTFVGGPKGRRPDQGGSSW